MTALLTPEIFHDMHQARKDDMSKKSFISRLLSGANATEDSPREIIEHEAELTYETAAPKKLAVDHAHGVISRALESHREEEARLLREINTRMEELRQVRVTLDALGSAYTILHKDRETPALAPPLT
jgi:hypothetical protein